jgi:hypothetical protein
MALSDNLVSYWKLDESSGNAVDSVGSDTGTNSSVTYSAGKINNAGNFTRATPSRLAITGNGSTANGSLSMWIKGTFATDNSDYGVFSKVSVWNATGQPFIYIRRRDSESKAAVMGMDVYNNSQESYSTSNISTSGWSHCVWVWNTSAKTIKFYIDGTLINTVTLGTMQTPVFSSIVIGDGILTARAFQGQLDEIGFWDRELTGAEITELYNSGNGNQYPFGTAYTLALALGTFVLTGFDTTFRKALKMISALGTFTLTGYDALFSMGKGIVAEVGTFVLTGYDALLSSSRSMISAVGSFTLTGFDAIFTKGQGFIAGVGTFILTGYDAGLRRLGWRNKTKVTDTAWTEKTKVTDTVWTNKDKTNT